MGLTLITRGFNPGKEREQKTSVRAVTLIENQLLLRTEKS
jgi:hypothetical protein